MEWLKNLPNDALAAHELVLDRFSKLERQNEARLQWLLAVDTALHSHQRRLVEEYAHTRRISAEDEARKWQAGYTVHEAWARAYLAALQDKPSRTLTITVAAKVLHHRGRAAVWRSFRYLTSPIGWWLDLHKIYALAEQEGFAAERTDLYPDEPPVSCRTLYLRTLMLETLNLSNMTHEQILAADNWLRARIHAIPIEQEYRENAQLFYVDLTMDRGGRRIRNFKPDSAYRYWETDSIVADIEHDLLDDTQEFLDSDVLRTMHSEWSRTTYKRQRRSDDRTETLRNATVAHGIYATCQEVLNQSSGTNSPALGGEIWQIESTSNHGIGAVVSTELNIWLQIGRLIVLREEISFGMSVVGVIRNLKHQEAGKIYVGAEILSYMALYGSLQPVRAIEGSQAIPCIFISSDERRLKLSLLLPAIEYEAGAEFFLRLDNRLHRVRFNRLVEQKDDWVRVEIEVLKHLVSVPNQQRSLES